MVVLILPYLVPVILACSTLIHSDPCLNDIRGWDCVVEELADEGFLNYEGIFAVVEVPANHLFNALEGTVSRGAAGFAVW